MLGRKGPYAHYYVQIQPKGGSFVGEFFFPLVAERFLLRQPVRDQTVRLYDLSAFNNSLSLHWKLGIGLILV